MALGITKEDMLEAIKGSQGLVTKIQKKLEAAKGTKICWDTVDKYVHKWEACEAAVKAEKEAMLDLAENNIFKELVSGDTSTSKWYLKMKGKDRGYVETQDIRMTNTDPLNINLQGDPVSAEDLKDSSMVEVPDYDKDEEA